MKPLAALGLALTAAVIASCLTFRSSATAQVTAPSTIPATAPAANGGRMTLIGQPATFTVPEGKAVDGTPLPPELRTEVYADDLIARTDLPAGTYTVEVIASENSFARAGMRVFDIDAVSGGKPADDGQGDPGIRTTIAHNVDLFALAGGAGKPSTLKATVKHAGGALRIVFHSTVDNAKFNAIRILDSQGNKVAWLFAQDVADAQKSPDQPPVIAGPVIWKDPSQPMEKRVADLVRRMTLKEKVQQLMHRAPEDERLGIPAYNYWSEALHGVARNGYATVFPQAIGMAATFDPLSMHGVGDAIATEARAKYNDWQASGGGGLLSSLLYTGSKGLTFWSPNINIFRDPRWGRGQETYGEDPFLTGTMAVAFIRGMQGDNPKYFKVVATAKHFAVHSGPEPLRHEFNAAPPIRDFYETYLPHFEMAVRQGHVYSIMGAYNRVYGSPACESDLLLKTILRQDWGFQGYVVSDCGAIDDIWNHHEVEDSRAAAAAGAVLAGCDLECGNDYWALSPAVDLNLIGEGAIDRALSRVLLSRFKLGLFDPPAQVPYSTIKISENMSPANSALSLKMARESMVLLKNDGTLPLSKSAKKIAVVGPNADSVMPLLANYNGTAKSPVTVLGGIRNAFKGQIVSLRGCDNAAREDPSGGWQIVPDICLHPAGSADPGETGLKAEYFTADDLSGKAVLTRTEKQIDIPGRLELDWVLPGVPQAGSIRWSGDFVAPEDGEYVLAAVGSATFRFLVNGQMITNMWGSSYSTDDSADSQPAGTEPATTATKPDEAPLDEAPHALGLKMKAGQRVSLRIEARPSNGVLDLQFYWKHVGGDLTKLVADRVKDADAIIYVGGLDGHMEAEEGDIRGLFKGFDKGDRQTAELPAVQTALLKALVATGKPVVFVNMTGSASAIPWEAQHVNAILQAWYPGQSGGTAVADVLFGDYNPAGRLPVTFYAATTDLPAFTDYAMKNRTYRYFTGKALWPFGHGLSYTTFKYANLTAGAAEAAPADTLTAGLDVTNTGQRDGDEVVQLYAAPVQPAAGDALERLVAFERVPIRAGQTAHVNLSFPVQALRNWDVQKKAYAVPPGRYTLRAGASSADIKISREIMVK